MPDIESCLRTIRDDRTRGANQLAGDARGLLSAAAQAAPEREAAAIFAEAGELAARLLTIRPSMAAIGNWALYWWQELSARPADAVELSAELAADRAALRDTAIEALDGSRAVLTLSYSSTVEQVLSAASGVERVVICEGRPRYEGRRLAEALEGGGRKVELDHRCRTRAFRPEDRSRAVRREQHHVRFRGDQ